MTKIKEATKAPFHNDSTAKMKGHGSLENTDPHGHVADRHMEVQGDPMMERVSSDEDVRR